MLIICNTDGKCGKREGTPHAPNPRKQLLHGRGEAHYLLPEKMCKILLSKIPRKIIAQNPQ